MAKSSSSSSNKFKFPSTPFHLSLLAAVFALAITRFFFLDGSDRHHCNALLNTGRWLDSAHKQWQPEGCMLLPYNAKSATKCLVGRQVVFIGDSTVRQVFFATLKHIDPLIQTTGEKHSDRTVVSKGVKFDFFWDPFLNTSKTDDLLNGRLGGIGAKPTLAVIGSGLWYLRQSSAGGMTIWQDKIDNVFSAVASGGSGARAIADQVILLPVENAVEARMSPERRATVYLNDIAAMNQYLDKKNESPVANLAIPSVFNQILEGLDDQTQDGLHFADSITKVQANILLNLRCNDVMPKKFPFDKTCCSQYPLPNWVQILILVVLLAWAPAGLYFYSRPETASSVFAFFPDQKYLLPCVIFGFSISFLFVADRTALFLKENKQYDALTFAGLCGITFAGGLLTMKPAEKDLGFLNREQTDEWKGWMQIVILIYHYVGASKISGIYNPVRVLVAAYLFMSGYGHLFFFLKKGDYGFARVANILIRLNLLVVTLAYIMDTDYLSYYFSPLVTIWFLIIWITMWSGNKYNDRTPFLVGKLVFASLLTAAYFSIEGPLEATFSFLNLVFATTWNAKEWRFRVALDMWIVWGGMLTALVFIKIKEHRLNDRAEWATWQRWSIVGSAITMALYFAFELTRKDKFVYNIYHPYISIFPVLAYTVLRNATPYLRSTNSKLFIYIGQCSLETFILQFYIYLSADTKGIIMMIPGGPWLRPINFIITSLIFVYLSNQVATATGSLTSWICSVPSSTLPRTVAPAAAASADYVPLSTLGDASGGTKEVIEEIEETPTSKSEVSMLSKIGEVMRKDLRIKFVFIILGLWALNRVYPVSK